MLRQIAIHLTQSNIGNTVCQQHKECTKSDEDCCLQLPVRQVVFLRIFTVFSSKAFAY